MRKLKLLLVLLKAGPYTKLSQGLEKVIPDTPRGEVPIHLRNKQLFADSRTVVYPWEQDVDVPKKQDSNTKAKDDS